MPSWIDTSDKLQELFRTVPDSLNYEVAPEDILKIITTVAPIVKQVNFNGSILNIATIMEIMKLEDLEKRKIKLATYEDYELLNPTDFNKPNFFSSHQLYDNQFNIGKMGSYEKQNYSILMAKATFPIRLSLEQAKAAELLTRESRMLLYKKHGIKFTADAEHLEKALYMAELSPAAFADFFFYPNLYKQGEKNLTFSEENFAIHPFQKIFLESNNNHVALLVSRQIGKTTVLNIILCWYLFMKVGFRGFFCAADAIQVDKFINEMFIRQAGKTIGGKLSEYMYKIFGEFKVAGTVKTLEFSRRNDNELLPIARIYSGFPRGDNRFTGSGLQGLFIDESSTYEVDPFRGLFPILDSYGHLAFSFFTTTQRGEGNPFINIMNRPDFRLISRNIYVARDTDRITEQFYKSKEDAYELDQYGWNTEYECIIPSVLKGVAISVSDISRASSIIDTKLNEGVDPYLGRKYNWKQNDKTLFQKYDLVEYTLGVDWNLEHKGNNLTLLAIVTEKKGKRVNRQGDLAIDTKYVIFNTYRVNGEYLHYNSAILINLLIDKYDIKKIYCDFGNAQSTINQAYALNEHLHVTKQGRTIYTPDRYATHDRFSERFNIFKFVSFQSKLVDHTVDDFGIYHENKHLLGPTLVNTIINLVKSEKILISQYESMALRLSNFFVPDPDSPDEMPYDGSRTWVLKQPDMKLDYKAVTVDNYTKYFKHSKAELTVMDELRMTRYDTTSKKYVPTDDGKKNRVEDDRIVSLGLALYPSIHKYDGFFFDGLVKDKDIEKLKEDDSNILVKMYAATANEYYNEDTDGTFGSYDLD